MLDLVHRLSRESVRQTLRQQDFIASIIDFRTENLSDETRAKIERTWLTNPDFNFEKINNASTACGPLVKWLISQLNFSKILNSVEPLQREMEGLEAEAVKLRAKQTELNTVIKTLEDRIQQVRG